MARNRCTVLALKWPWVWPYMKPWHPRNLLTSCWICKFARQLGISSCNPMDQQWAMWKVGFWGNFTRLSEQHAPVGLADGFYTMQTSYWERSMGTQASFEITVEPTVTYPVSHITFHFWSRGCYISTLLLLTQHPAWGPGMSAPTQRCSDYLYLPKKMKIFLVRKSSSYLETTTTSYQRGLVHFFKWSREFYDVSWFLLWRCFSQKMTVRVKMITTKKAS